ncbi:MAG: ABC transporter ATP-binding protein [Roseburia sp.]|nr:ABC transporter ATP-binding protein [Roseburia sp.]MCM1099436.1 ABC transporter ATP-binding protein [Ruminococcus flavefaciens]
MLRIEHVTKHYKGSDKGITDLSLHIAPGDLYAFIGHNGAGKTTTLKCAAGIQGFDSGEIRIDGLDIRKEPLEVKRRMAYIPDNPDLYEYLTGIQYLNFIADVFRVGEREREERIGKYGEAFEITSSLGDLISTYSHGMKQKLALLSALVHQPKLWLLDEPFVGLDPKAAVILKEIMREVCRSGGAIFFSTHVLEVAEKLCNKVAMIKDGSLAACGGMDEFVGQGRSLESLFMEVVEHAEADQNHVPAGAE